MVRLDFFCDGKSMSGHETGRDSAGILPAIRQGCTRAGYYGGFSHHNAKFSLAYPGTFYDQGNR